MIWRLRHGFDLEEVRSGGRDRVCLFTSNRRLNGLTIPSLLLASTFRGPGERLRGGPVLPELSGRLPVFALSAGSKQASIVRVELLRRSARACSILAFACYANGSFNKPREGKWFRWFARWQRWSF